MLDDPAADPRLVRRMLGEIATANRWFGGHRALRVGLAPLVDAGDRGRELVLLDIGTGAGDLPAAAAAWCARRGVGLRAVALERHPAAARLARASGLATAVACGSRPPLADRSVDLVLLSQLLHHLDDDGAEMLLRRAARLARRGVIVADLRPSRMAGGAFRLAGRTLGFDPATVDDGVTSLARGRDAARLTALLERAAMPGAVVRELPFARVVASWRAGAA